MTHIKMKTKPNQMPELYAIGMAKLSSDVGPSGHAVNEKGHISMLDYTILTVFIDEEHANSRELLECTTKQYGLKFVYAHNKEDTLRGLRQYPDAVLVIDGKEPPFHGDYYGDGALRIIRQSGYKGPLVFYTWPSQYIVGEVHGVDATLISGTTPFILKTTFKRLIEKNRGRPVDPSSYRPHTFFIAHSSSDHQFAAKLGRALLSYGYGVWFDEWQIRTGDSLIAKIQEAVDRSDYLVVVISPRSVRSAWVQKEVSAKLTDELAFKRPVVLPVIAKRCKLPSFLRDKYYITFEDDFNAALSTFLTKLPEPPMARTRRPDRATQPRGRGYGSPAAGSPSPHR